MSALTPIELQGILDQVVRDVTQRICGLPLLKQNCALSGDVCTVQTTFEGGYEGTIILCADTPLLFRLTRLFLQEESVNAQDMEDFTKEYLNIICGQMVGRLFQTSRCTCRFHIPIFSAGGHSVESWSPHQSVLHYSNPCNECVQLIHQLSFVPISDGLTSMSAKG